MLVPKLQLGNSVSEACPELCRRALASRLVKLGFAAVFVVAVGAPKAHRLYQQRIVDCVGFVVGIGIAAHHAQAGKAGPALILYLDRFMLEARALTNLIGNGVATVVAAKWENELDMQELDAELSR